MSFSNDIHTSQIYNTNIKYHLYHVNLVYHIHIYICLFQMIYITYIYISFILVESINTAVSTGDR